MISKVRCGIINIGNDIPTFLLFQTCCFLKANMRKKSHHVLTSMVFHLFSHIPEVCVLTISVWSLTFIYFLLISKY